MDHTLRRIFLQTQYLLDSAHIGDARIELGVGKKHQKSQGQRWCCAICGTYVTDDGQLLYVEGLHDHDKINPHGHRFRFRSFKHAEGCEHIGQLTAEHSWFSGYLWQFAHCARCKNQLGWYFCGPGSFYGLINWQIVRCFEEKL